MGKAERIMIVAWDGMRPELVHAQSQGFSETIQISYVGDTWGLDKASVTRKP